MKTILANEGNSKRDTDRKIFSELKKILEKVYENVAGK